MDNILSKFEVKPLSFIWKIVYVITDIVIAY